MLVAIQLVLCVRVLLRPRRDPTSRLAWIVVILALPLVGIIAYLALGETNIGHTRTARLRAVRGELPKFGDIPGTNVPPVVPQIPSTSRPVFSVGSFVGDFVPVGGNRATLMADSNASIRSLVRDVDAAEDHVHILFYIWLPDHNGTLVAEALMNAAGRGVACRVLVDDIGSRDLIKSTLWAEMRAAGVQIFRALPVGNPILRMLNGRIDLRNHRKLVVIDNAITYCGSQNCADPEFLPKAKYAPWVDVMARFEGPVVRQTQLLFARDWMAHVDDNIRSLLVAPMPAPDPGFTAVVVATGPTDPDSPMSDMFQTLMYCAQRTLVITTPYFVPNEAIQSALCAAARRGIDTTIIFPARNDDFAVAATSRSYYEALIRAGVKVFEFQPGLLHAKTVTVDEDITLIGSSNIDRRSFDLNYENNILSQDKAFTADVKRRQKEFLAQSRPVKAEEVATWGWKRRLWQNAVAILGPVL